MPLIAKNVVVKSGEHLTAAAPLQEIDRTRPSVSAQAKKGEHVLLYAKPAAVEEPPLDATETAGLQALVHEEEEQGVQETKATEPPAPAAKAKEPAAPKAVAPPAKAAPAAPAAKAEAKPKRKVKKRI